MVKLVMSCSRGIRELGEGTLYVGELPEGCKLCLKGGKLVLFITGLCNERCWYCPVSRLRRKDVIYANNKPVRRFKDVIEEALLMDAEGTGITGGEPLLVKERLIEFIRALKRHLGEDHHIHLYTNGLLVTRPLLRELKNAGLDEIRIHPLSTDVLLKIPWARELGLKAGIEVPVIPGQEDFYHKLLMKAERLKADFVNLNELEFSESNCMALRLRGFSLKPSSQVAVAGSEELALKILEWARDNTSLNVHYCAASVKDAVQFKERLKRIARKVKRPHEEVDEEGLLVKGVIYLDGANPRVIERILKELKDELSRGRVLLNVRERRLEFHPSLLESILGLNLSKDIRLGMLREYPDRHLEAEFLPIDL